LVAATDDEADLLLPENDAADIPHAILGILVVGRALVKQAADETAQEARAVPDVVRAVVPGEEEEVAAEQPELVGSLDVWQRKELGRERQECKFDLRLLRGGKKRARQHRHDERARPRQSRGSYLLSEPPRPDPKNLQPDKSALTGEAADKTKNACPGRRTFDAFELAREPGDEPDGRLGVGLVGRLRQNELLEDKD
jgi:hypothetical protein